MSYNDEDRQINNLNMNYRDYITIEPNKRGASRVRAACESQSTKFSNISPRK